MKTLCERLEIRPGVTSLIGSGGKTSLLYHLAAELRRSGHTVLLTTTTHIRKPEQFAFSAEKETVCALLRDKGCACTGTEAEGGKLTAPSFDGWETLAEYVLVEADGARGLPLKAHLPHEPVLVPANGNTICVVGVSGLGQPVVAAAHRSARFAQLAQCGEHTKVEAAHIARVIEAERLCDRVLLNQTDTLRGFFATAPLKELAKGLSVPVVAGSLRQGLWEKLP